MNSESDDSERIRKFIKLSPSSFDKEDGDSEKERACFKDEMTQNDDVDDSEKEKCCKEKINRNTCPVKDKSEISTEKCDISDKSGKDSPHGLKFESLRTFDIKNSENKSWISNIQELPNGNIIMADFNNSKLHVYNQSHERQKPVIMQGNPCCIAVINGEKVAVTVHEKQTIALVNILSRKVLKFVNVGDCAHGITYNNDRIVVNCLKKGLQFMDLSGTVLHTITDVTGEASLCTSENGNIFCSLYWSHKVLCFDKDGQQLYSFSNLTMKCPRGITIDKKGQVLTSEFAKNKIHVINSEGTKSHVVLSKKHGINNPLCVMLDKNGSHLYVSNNDGESVTIFKLITS
jgi:sugar lactone lactonase YvrE